MPTYLMLTKLTAQGVQTLKANPARLREVNRDVAELGAEVLHQWATIGEYDFVNIVEAPDAATIAKVSLALGARADDVVGVIKNRVKEKKRRDRSDVGDNEQHARNSCDLLRIHLDSFLLVRSMTGDYQPTW